MSRDVQVIDEAERALSWSSDATLGTSKIPSVPQEPGLLVLVRGADAGKAHVVWVEAPDNLRHRARELAGYATVGPELGALLLHPDLRFRYAVVHDEVARSGLLARLRARVADTPESS